MSEKNKAILEKGNAAIAEGNNKGFLSLCADDTAMDVCRRQDP